MMNNMDKSFKIIIVDDNMRPHAAFLKRLEKKFYEAEVSLYDNVESAVEYITANLDDKMVVFMDCKFDLGEQGVDGLKQIREKTSLISVVMMSANALQEMDNMDLYSMINAEDVYFIKNSDMNRAEEIVRQINIRWQSHLDCVLEQWVKRHSLDEREKPYMRTADGVLSLNDILSRIRNRTAEGIRMERNILMLAVDLLTKDHVKAREI